MRQVINLLNIQINGAYIYIIFIDIVFVGISPKYDFLIGLYCAIGRLFESSKSSSHSLLPSTNDCRQRKRKTFNRLPHKFQFVRGQRESAVSYTHLLIVSSHLQCDFCNHRIILFRDSWNYNNPFKKSLDFAEYQLGICICQAYCVYM